MRFLITTMPKYRTWRYGMDHEQQLWLSLWTIANGANFGEALAFGDIITDYAIPWDAYFD